MILKFCIFWLFHLWVFAIFRPAEYSTGPESAEYRPEMLQLPQGPSEKKWGTITRRYSRATLKYVFGPQIHKMACFMSSLFISCHSWFFVAKMLLMWQYEISSFRIWSQNVRIVFRSKVMPIWSSVEALLTTYFWKFHVLRCLQTKTESWWMLSSHSKFHFFVKYYVLIFVLSQIWNLLVFTSFAHLNL